MENKAIARFLSLHDNGETCGSIPISMPHLVAHNYIFVVCFIIFEVVFVKMAI
jgi:hypothetical protein